MLIENDMSDEFEDAVKNLFLGVPVSTFTGIGNDPVIPIYDSPLQPTTPPATPPKKTNIFPVAIAVGSILLLGS